MKRYLFATLIALALLFGVRAQAQDSGYELGGSVIAAGGQISGGEYAMIGALGQPATRTMDGGDYTLGGGIFGGGDTAGGNIYLPLVRH